MDMDMGTMDGGDSSDGPLNDTGIDFTNITDATTFLGEILDDTDFQIDGNMYASNFWYGVCGVIAICAIFNIYSKLISGLRFRAAASNRSRPAAPANIFTIAMATTTAIFREASYSQYTPTTGIFSMIKVPPVGTILLLLAYFTWVIFLEFVNNSVEGAQYYTSLGVRAGWLAVAQVPLLILLAGKNNLIGLVSGISYERLNVLHRWVARMLILMAAFHMGFLHAAWNTYSLGALEYSTDTCIPTGWATFAVLLWINLSTLAPFRNMWYEFFVVQHILSWFGFVIAVIWHLPTTALYSRVYIFIPIGLYVVDRLIRTARLAWNNSRPARATLTAMEGGITKVCVQSKQIKNWTPGSHVFLSIPKFGICQSHPATIASIPSSHNGELVFLLKGHKGFTQRLHKSATNSSTSLLSKQVSAQVEQKHLAILDGPYGTHSNFAAFDTVSLIAGSTGITFILPILLDIAARASTSKIPVKRIQLLWVVKNTSWTSWVSSELQSAFAALNAVGIGIDIRIHVTCDDKFTSDENGEVVKECDCACDKSLGPCCCVDIEEQNDVITSAAVEKNGSIVKSAEPQFSEKETTSSSSSLNSGPRSAILPCASFHSGRPDFESLLWRLLEQAEGETGVAVCGSLGLSSEVRKVVMKCSDERGVHKGTGAQGVFLHAECFGW